MNLADIPARYAATQPGEAALIDGGRILTWSEFDRLVSRTAAHLLDLGLRPGQRLGLDLKDDADHVVAMLAAARMGAAFVPLDWRARPEEKACQASAFDVRLTLTAAGRAAPAGIEAVALDDDWHAAVARARTDPPAAGDGDAELFVAVSSGTTGRPKGAAASHRRFFERIAECVLSFGPNQGHRYLSAVPLCFAAGWHHLFYLMAGGSTVILHPTLFSAEEYVEAAARHRATFAFLVPTALRWLLQLPGRATPLLPTARVLLTGADVMLAEEKRAVQRRVCPHLHESYSSSATGTMAVLRPEDVATRADSVGQPNLLTEVQIVDDADRPLSRGETGRLRVRGAGVACAYVGADSANDFRDGFYYTGELAHRDRGGFLHLVGRTSDMILRAGVNLQPQEIEAVVGAHPAVAEVAVVGRPHPLLGQEPVAFVVTAAEVDPGSILAFCRARLNPHKLPAAIVQIEALPKSAAGKVRRAELSALAARSHG